jgi:tripartite motif-containing protein 71
MIKRRTVLSIGLLLVGLLAACSGKASTPQLAPVIPPTPETSTVAPAPTPTPAITPTNTPVILGGDQPTVQMDLVGTITASPVPFAEVRGVALDQQGNLYVVDYGAARVLKYDPNGKFLLEWGSPGTGDGQFDMSGHATGFAAVDSQGNIFVTETHRVQKFDSNGKFLAKFGSDGTGAGQFSLALALAIDKQDRIYVVDITNNDVQVFDDSGKFLLKWGEKGFGDGQFQRPAAVAIDQQGNILVADVDAGRLQKFDSTGKLLSWAYLGAVQHKVIGPIALAFDDKGQLFVGEYANGRVSMFDSSGKFLAVWGDTGTYAEQMSESGGLALGKDGSVYVSDAFNHRVLKYRQHP